MISPGVSGRERNRCACVGGGGDGGVVVCVCVCVWAGGVMGVMVVTIARALVRTFCSFFLSPHILGLFARAPASKKKRRTQEYDEKEPLKVRKAFSFF
jgi:hypothetical protein